MQEFADKEVIERVRCCENAPRAISLSSFTLSRLDMDGSSNPHSPDETAILSALFPILV
jgi:hypothetical protein